MNLLKGIDKEIAVFGLLIVSIGFQIMHLDNVIIDNIAGGIIAILGVLVIFNARVKTH